MSTAGWVTIPAWDDELETQWSNPYPIGARVQVTPDERLNVLNAGRTGTVVTWGRSRNADDHWKAEHRNSDIAGTCEYGTECDALVDNEGPVIRYDDQAPGDESLDWYPGQAMSILDPLEGP